jgi:hypothetical protein
MGNGRHRCAPLGLDACWKKNYHTCENELTNHNSHLKARPGPFTNNLTLVPNKPNNKDAPSAA